MFFRVLNCFTKLFANIYCQHVLENVIFMRLPDGTVDIVSVKRIRDDKAMFTVTADGIVGRVSFWIISAFLVG